jgi:glutamate dehydrogenase
MTAAASVEKLQDALSRLSATDSSPVFQAFCAAVARHVRGPWLERHGAEGAAAQIAALWKAVSQATSPVQVQVEAGEGSTELRTRMADQPFIVDTLRLLLNRSGHELVSSLNAVVAIGRDGAGQIVRVDEAGDPAESLVSLEISGADPEGKLAEAARANLELAQLMVADFQSITDLVDAAALQLSRLAERTPDQAEDLRESVELLRWLLSDNFVFMGATAEGRKLGMARGGSWSISELEGGGWSSGLVSVRKGAQESPVHRPGRVDELKITIPSISGEPRVILLQGLFTYRALTQQKRHIPLLRRVVASILRGQESKPGSYRYKGIANAFDSLPAELLFTASQAEIVAAIDRVLEAENEQELRLHLVQLGADVTYALVAMPRTAWSDRLRVEIQEALVKATGASYADHGIYLGRYQTMLAHYYMTGTQALSGAGTEALLASVTEMATPWSDRLGPALAALVGDEQAADLAERYGSAFPEVFQQVTPPERAARDVVLLEALVQRSQVQLDIFALADGRLALRVYRSGALTLSEFLPVLDNFGLVISDQYSDQVKPEGGKGLSIDTFHLQGVAGLSSEQLQARGPLLAEAVRAVLDRKMTDDVLNRILLPANLSWEAVDLVRAYYRYSTQLGLNLSLERVQAILAARIGLLNRWWQSFEDRFNPELPGDRAAAVSAADEAYANELREITDGDQDTVFRTLGNLLDSTLRTNFYRQDRKEHYISFKISCAAVKQMPSPRMWVEVWVHHRDVEGIHLRGARVARGGLRWSDRTDFRREVLDLVSTQMVKNVIIVPEGSKGGFYMKVGPSDPAARRKRADEVYQIFIRGLLDITDNFIDGQAVPPARVVRRDGDDPYLVVAADKGTAHLSDTANKLSREYGFWLDDAFASGGSNGYDHKVVGITARGGWMLVRRHFREMGLDATKDFFTCVGVGDCGGDVFGNGVIEHPTMKLYGAFNHVHIFLDPDPDPVVGFAERKRLFDEVKGWDAYDRSKISQGGGVFSRRAKSIPLSPELQQMLGVLQTELAPDVVIRLLLRQNVDLLWNGGIGTYVKATSESHEDAGDPANDNLRVNASELRCKVVGEGGNLGFTKAGRIEFAQAGGRLNTDAIDNSGGVDMSDHEVNLKILLNPLVRSGAMTWEQRNVLLESLTGEVAQAVLKNNDEHGRLLSLDQIRSQRDPVAISQAIDWVCRLGNASRSELKLPSDADLARRAANRQGLTRPELAVLQAHVKLHVFRAVKEADPAAVPGYHDKVLGYFPQRIAAEYGPEISQHLLYKSIGWTVTVNEIVNETGAAFLPLLSELSGASMATIAAAWNHAMKLVGGARLRAEIEGSGASLDAQYRAWVAVTDAVSSLVSLWVSAGEPGPTVESADRILEALAALKGQGGTALEARLSRRTEELSAPGLSAELVGRLALLGELVLARDVALLAGTGDLSEALVRQVAVGEASRLLPTVRTLEARQSESGWDPVAFGILRNRYLKLVRELVVAVQVGEEARLGADRVGMRLSRNDLAGMAELVGAVLGERPPLAALMVGEERIRAWTERYRASRAG